MNSTTILSQQEAAVRRAEGAIAAEEGFYHVGGIYFASEADSARQRRWEAERRVREEHRELRTCAFCFEQIASGVAAVVIAMRNVHPRCAKEFDAWISGDPAGNEEQSRKSPESDCIHDDDLVEWGEWIRVGTPNERYDYKAVRWVELSVYERHTVERGADNVLRGGFPL